MVPLTIFVLIVSAAIASTAVVPDYIRICNRKNPDLSGCITESIIHIQPYLAKGIPELNVPALEPLILKELVAVQGTGIKLSATDLHVRGSSDFTVSNLKADLENLVFEADIRNPVLFVEGQYQMGGKLLLLPLSGSGPMQGNFTKCMGAMRMTTELRKNAAGEDYLYCKELKIKLSVGTGQMHFDNLFGGDRALGELINSAINSNFDVIAKELMPLIESALAEVFREISNNILQSFTYQQLFPDS